MNEETVKYPGFRWFVGITFVVVIISSALSLISITPLLGEVAKTIGLDIGVTAGIVMSTFNLLVAFGAIAGGLIIDKFGVIKVWFGCLALLLIGQILIPFLGGSGKGMTIIRVIQGAGSGPIMGCAAALAAQWFPKKERGILTGMQGLAMGAGVAIGTTLGPVLAKAAGSWQKGLAMEGIFTAVALVMVIIVAMGPKPPVVEEITESSDSLNIAQEVKTAMLQPATFGALICAFGLAWIFQAFNDLTPSFLAIPAPVGLGKGALLAGQMFSIVSIAFMIGSMGGEFITEKIFKGSVRSTVLAGFIVSAVTVYGLKITGIVSSQGLLMVDLIICGLFMSFIQPQVNAFVAKNYPGHITGKVGGTIYGLSVFGGVGGATAGAYFLHSTGRYMMSITVIIIVCVIGAAGTMLLNPPKIYAAENVKSKSHVS